MLRRACRSDRRRRFGTAPADYTTRATPSSHPNRERDPFGGTCPYHGDCWEGLASGEAIRARWGRTGEESVDQHIWHLEAEYLALGLVNVICTLSPERVVLGGGVMKQPQLLPLVRKQVSELLAGYVSAPELGGDLDEYLVAPALGDRAGVLGSLELARSYLGP